MSILESLGFTQSELLGKLAEKILDELEDRGEAIAHDVVKRVEDRFAATVAGKIDAACEAAVRDVTDAQFTPVDHFGRPQGKPTTIRELLTVHATQWLAGKVDGYGKPSCDSNAITRGQWVAERVARETLDKHVQAKIAEAVTAAKLDIQRRVAEFIAAQLLAKK